MHRKILTISYGKEGARVIPSIPFITEQPRPLNSRLWQLHAREAEGTITDAERAELNALCNELERGNG